MAFSLVKVWVVLQSFLLNMAEGGSDRFTVPIIRSMAQQEPTSQRRRPPCFQSLAVAMADLTRALDAGFLDETPRGSGASGPAHGLPAVPAAGPGSCAPGVMDGTAGVEEKPCKADHESCDPDPECVPAQPLALTRALGASSSGERRGMAMPDGTPFVQWRPILNSAKRVVAWRSTIMRPDTFDVVMWIAPQVRPGGGKAIRRRVLESLNVAACSYSQMKGIMRYLDSVLAVMKYTALETRVRPAPWVVDVIRLE